MYVVFSISKIIFNLAIILICVVRPFFPNWTKLRAIWVGQTVIYYQLLVYSSLLPGVFGYTIDMGQEGMLKSSRRYAFGATAPKIKTEQEFVVFKFIQNEMIPSVFEEAHVELITMTVITVLVAILKFFSGGARDNKVLVIAREIKSGVFIFSFIPFVVHFSHQFLSVAYTKDHDVYSVIIIVISIGICCIYANHFMRMGQGIRDINYLHGKHVYQEGKVRVEQGLDWGFDSYISMETKTWVRILEFVAYIILALTFCGGFVLDATSAAVCFFIYIFLLVCQI